MAIWLDHLAQCNQVSCLRTCSAWRLRMLTATPNFSNSCPGFKALFLRKMLLWRQ